MRCSNTLILILSLLISSALAARQLTDSESSAPKCVCVFDFDETLRIWQGDYGDAAPADAEEVIRACQSTPCHIAIASANRDREKLESVLPQNYPGIFTRQFFKCSAFQFGADNKAPMLWSISWHFDIRDTACIVLFDDKWHNKNYADEVGTQFVKVEPTTGVMKQDFNTAMNALPDRCFVFGGTTGI